MRGWLLIESVILGRLSLLTVRIVLVSLGILFYGDDEAEENKLFWSERKRLISRWWCSSQ